MPTLQRVFRPASVAVIGASDSPGKVGTIVLRNVLGAGFEGPVIPINARNSVVQGQPACRAIGDCHQQVDLAIVCTPANTVSEIVRQCGEVRVGGLIILTAGFRESGSSGRAAESTLAEEARRFPDMRIIGPNCLGVIVPQARLNASFAASMPPAGRLAFVSQSGALCTAILDWACDQALGFSQFVSIGNMLDVDFGDMLDYLANDPYTDAVLLYIESITNARHFMSAARACSFRKPIVACKAGRFAASAKAASSHTGAMVGVDSVYQAALERAGIVRVHDVRELFDCAELLARPVRVRGDRLAIVTNAGGPGVMASDALLEQQCTLAELSAGTIGRLNELLPPGWSHNNPVDVLGDATPERYAAALRAVVKDEHVDAALAILTPQAMTDPTGTAECVAAIAEQGACPILTSWMGGRSVQPGRDILNRHGIPTVRTPEEAVLGFASLVKYARNRELLYETPHEVVWELADDLAARRRRLEPLLAGSRDMLYESEAKEFLATYGIAVTQPVPAKSGDEAVALATRVGFPVVLKVVSPEITHKTDVGGVELDLANEEQVRQAYQRMLHSVRKKCPGAAIEAITVQPMVTQAGGIELILGAKKDPVFGPVIMLGVGGIAAEIFGDRALALPPLNERLAMHMLESLRAWPLIKGYRGRGPVADVDKLVELLLRFSQLIADFPEIQELDANPVLVRGSEMIVLDARLLIDRQALGQPKRGAFPHLAICPYPADKVRRAQLPDGSTVTLRPIKPEDEALWQALLARCSRESLWARFRFMFKFDNHEAATRFCFVDYDREFTMVAERGLGEQRQLLGVARIVEVRGTGRAEFAILIADDWQGQGLGKLLTRACLDSVNRDCVHCVYGETERTNTRMIALFKHFGFELEPGEDRTLLRATKVL
ncbi:MAG: GNAT family N-acetyltransferase [Pirellulales bacterium]